MSLTHLLTQEVTVKTESGRSLSGAISFSSPEIKKARIERKAKLVLDANGGQRQTSHVIVTETQIPMESRVWLPGDDTAVSNDARTVVMLEEAETPAGYTIYQAWV